MLVVTSSPVRLKAGSMKAKVPSGTIPLQVPAKVTGEFFALMTSQLYEGYRIVSLKKFPNFRVEFEDD